MKILALQGSPRKDGNTQAVLDLVLDSAVQVGARTDVVQLSELTNLSGCLECFGCQKTRDEPGCVVDDDMQSILAKAVEADVIVWVTPVFCWSPSWLIKMPMDRFFCMFKFDGGVDNYECLLDGRKMAAVISAGGGEDDGADLVAEALRRLAEYCRTEWLGALIAANVETPDAIRADKDLTKRAQAFGRTLAS